MVPLARLEGEQKSSANYAYLFISATLNSAPLYELQALRAGSWGEINAGSSLRAVGPTLRAGSQARIFTYFGTMILFFCQLFITALITSFII
jgi:hypothetical protein